MVLVSRRRLIGLAKSNWPTPILFHSFVILRDVKIPDFADERGARPDHVGEKFRQENGWHGGRYIRDQLGRHANDEIVRRALKTVFVADKISHGSPAQFDIVD